MSEFSYLQNEHGENQSCYSCGSEVPVIQTKHQNLKMRGTDSENILMCEICYTTYAGNAYCYPNQYDSGMSSIIAGIGNLIRRDIGAFKDAPVTTDQTEDK